jgi:hypothetical protein
MGRRRFFNKMDRLEVILIDATSSDDCQQEKEATPRAAVRKFSDGAIWAVIQPDFSDGQRIRIHGSDRFPNPGPGFE